MKRSSIKTLLKTASVCVFSFSIAMHVFANNSFSEKEEAMINPLINALRSTNHPVSNKVAETLLSLKNTDSSYDLHLRNADLTYNQIKLIAEAIKTVHENGGPSLQSFSMSYNSSVGDEGVLILVKNLPHTITEIGLVQSGIGDKGAEALIRWATHAKQLRWLCVEENIFSNNIKDRLRTFGQERSDLLVIF
ncbi:hypothetical protein ABXT60_02870 [Candidatus Njordibacter sp. Uisw_056]|uniref:hypothetical protein n=1 Tax=Candidatus Njordibacter sp. Uisw_056 TaxID=3230973 RepID=UPI003D45AAB8